MTWEIAEATELHEPLIRQILDNQYAAVRIADFIDKEACRRSRKALEQAQQWSFYEGVTPPLGRLGITLYEHFGAKEEYLAKALKESVARRYLLRGLPDPMEMLLKTLNYIWPNGASLATESGRPYFAGVFRRGAGSTIHADWAPRDAQGWSIELVRAQIGWNLYYDVPDHGGELVIYNAPWAPEMESHARQRFNDYNPEIFEGRLKVAIKVRQGELVLFNAKNAHAVRPSPEGNRRLCVGSFIGEMPSHELVFWS